MSHNDFIQAGGLVLTLALTLYTTSAEIADASERVSELSAQLNVVTTRDENWNLKLGSIDAESVPGTIYLVPTFQDGNNPPVEGRLVPLSNLNYTLSAEGLYLTEIANAKDLVCSAHKKECADMALWRISAEFFWQGEMVRLPFRKPATVAAVQ